MHPLCFRGSQIISEGTVSVLLHQPLSSLLAMLVRNWIKTWLTKHRYWCVYYNRWCFGRPSVSSKRCSSVYSCSLCMCCINVLPNSHYSCLQIPFDSNQQEARQYDTWRIPQGMWRGWIMWFGKSTLSYDYYQHANVCRHALWKASWFPVHDLDRLCIVYITMYSLL